MRKVAKNGKEEKRNEVGLMDSWPPGLHSSQLAENIGEVSGRAPPQEGVDRCDRHCHMVDSSLVDPGVSLE